MLAHSRRLRHSRPIHHPGPQLFAEPLRIGVIWFAFGLLACGYAHSLVTNLGNQIYSFGNNTYGQLGLGDKESRNVPFVLGALWGREIVLTACGDHHTIVVMKEQPGMGCDIFSFGANYQGQLGLKFGEDDDETGPAHYEQPTLIRRLVGKPADNPASQVRPA